MSWNNASQQQQTQVTQQAAPLDCAWCLREQGIRPTSGSHGICLPHKQDMVQQAQERKRRAR